jgi:hypothetical protein
MKKLCDSDLVHKVEELLDVDRESIIRQCGYVKKDSLLFEHFYAEYLNNSDFTTIDIDDEDGDDYKDYMFEVAKGCSPIVEGGSIKGFYIFRISRIASKKKWNEKNWKRDNNDEGNMEGPFEVGVVTEAAYAFQKRRTYI